MPRLRVVTLNLWGDHAPLEARLDAAAEGLGALSPDVVLLQEVRVGDGLPNTAAQLLRRLSGYSMAYAAATTAPAGTWGPGSGMGEEGLAILARPAIREHRHRALPEARRSERRILLSARLEVGGGTVWCHTTHLHWRLRDGAARERQVLAIDEALRELQSDSPQILGGDFNAPPDSDELRFLCGRHSLEGRRTYYQDAFARVRPDEHGWTWTRRNPGTAAVAWLELDRRIDYLLVTPESRDGRGRLHDARVVLDGPGSSGTWPSDHLGVLLDVEV
jgi:endonuclease/exonuclease/phosphatase family metal-dependent hydrolase